MADIGLLHDPTTAIFVLSVSGVYTSSPQTLTTTYKVQLRAFKDANQALHHFPDLFMFVLQYGTQCIVSHFVESRHRQISLHASGSAAHIVPGGQSALMRRAEAEANMSTPKFMAWVCSKWRSTQALGAVLSPVCRPSELAKLSYHQRVQKIYGADVDSQFRTVPQVEVAIQAWAVQK